jgi:hypothetical protein
LRDRNDVLPTEFIIYKILKQVQHDSLLLQRRNPVWIEDRKKEVVHAGGVNETMALRVSKKHYREKQRKPLIRSNDVLFLLLFKNKR